MEHSEPTRPVACPWAALALIGLAAAAIRFFVGIRFNLTPEGDGIRGFQFYLGLAENLVEGHGYHWNLYGPKFANRPPAYPLMLAGTLLTGWYPWGALAIQSVLGGIGAALTGALAFRFASPRAAIVAAIVALAYPYSVLADTSLIEHGMLTVALLVIALAWRRFAVSAGFVAALGLGAALGAAMMVRVTVTACVPMVLLAVLLAAPRGRRLRSAVLVAIAVAAVVSPWVVRNARTVGAATLSTDTWRAMWVGHNDHTLELYPEQSIDDAERAAWRDMAPGPRERILALEQDEVAQAAVFRELAIDWIRENPGLAVKGVFVKAWAFLTPSMNPPTDPPAWKGTVHAVSWAVVAIAGLAGLFLLRSRWREWLIVVALYGGFLAAAMITWGQSRFRAPLDVLLIAVAAALVSPRRAGERNLAGAAENG